MAESYPSIPIGLVAGNSHNDGNKIARNDVQAGPPRFELISEAGPAFFKTKWLFTDQEMQIFDGWFKYTLSFGAKSFDMNLKIGGGLKSHELFFDKSYQVTQNGDKWAVRANLIALEKQYDTRAVYEGLVGEGIIAEHATQALAIASLSQTDILLDVNSSEINVAPNSWAAISLDPAFIGSYTSLIDLVEGSNVTVELWEKVASVDSVVDSDTGQTAPVTVSSGVLNGGATAVYFLLKNVDTENQFIKISIPS